MRVRVCLREWSWLDIVGRRQPKRGNTRFPVTRMSYCFLLQLYASCTWYEVPTICVCICSIGRERGVIVGSPAVRETYTHRDYWHNGEILKHGCRCTAAAVLLYTRY